MNYLLEAASIYDDIRRMIYENAQDAEYLAAVEAGDMDKAQQMVDAVRLLPREVFYVGDIEVIRNPKDRDYQQLSAEYTKEYPNDRSGDPKSRFTTDANGNRWIWRSDLGTHYHVEPMISKKEGVYVNQNESNHNMNNHSSVKRDKSGNVIPLSQRFSVK
jgi:hypothetical protein